MSACDAPLTPEAQIARLLDDVTAKTRSCHLCDEALALAHVVGTKARGGRDSQRVACTRCGLIQVYPRPSDETLAEYYRGAYWREHPPVGLNVSLPDGTVRRVEPWDADYGDAVTLMHETRAAAVIAALELEAGAGVLEVGCADGRTLEALQGRGMTVDGVEPDGDRRLAAERRIDGMVLDSIEPLADTWDAVVSFHVLEHAADPLAMLRSMAARARAVFVEVPDVDAPGLPLTEHWQTAHLFDFSADTLRALFQRAGLEPTIDARGGQLRAWATVPRMPYEPVREPWRGLPDGRTVAARLAALEAPPTPVAADERSVFERFLEGEPIASLGPDAEREIRREIAAWREDVQRMAIAWDQACDLVGAMSERCDEQGAMRVEAWHEDPWQHGFVVGEGHALLRARTLFGLVANAMRMREVADGRGE